jgi:tRNA(Ile)-lysidine synthase
VTSSLTAALAAFNPGLPLAVAYSGGADSTALLLACAQKWPGQVQAIHVHHGLQAAADSFEQHCREFCAHRQLPLTVKRVHAGHSPGQSPEDAARKARYLALQAAVQEADAACTPRHIALAQHADDQIETLLLALSRGSGLPGLSAMPQRWTRSGVTYHRPLLDVRASDIRDWLKQREVAWIEDPSNQDQGFTRNRIRAQLLPALEAAFPQFRDTFARSAAHAAQAQTVMLEVAAQDMVALGSPPLIEGLQRLSWARQANVLRHWLRTTYDCVASTAQLTELQDQLAACTTRGHRIHIKVGSGFVERRARTLHWYNPRVLL